MADAGTREENFRRVGDEFCDLLTEVRTEGMRVFIEEWKAGRRDRAMDTLRQLSFLWEVAEKVCEQGGEKGG